MKKNTRNVRLYKIYIQDITLITIIKQNNFLSRFNFFNDARENVKSIYNISVAKKKVENCINISSLKITFKYKICVN